MRGDTGFEMHDALWPPEIPRHMVVFNAPQVLEAFIPAADYVAYLSEYAELACKGLATEPVQPLAQKLYEGIVAGVTGVVWGGGVCRNKEYFKMALEAYLRYWDVTPTMLLADQEKLWEMAQLEAAMLAPSVQEVMFTSHFAYTFLQARVTAEDKGGQIAQLKELLSAFFYLTFCSILQDDSLQSLIKVQLAPLPGSPTGEKSVIPDDLDKAYGGQPLATLANVQRLPALGVDPVVAAQAVIETREGFAAAIYHNGDALLFRYPALESRVRKLYDDLVTEFGKGPNNALLVQDLTKFTHLVERRYAAISGECLRDAAIIRTKKMCAEIEEGFLKNIPEKFALVRNIVDTIADLRKAVVELDADFVVAKRKERDQVRSVFYGTKMGYGVAEFLSNPLHAVLASSDEEQQAVVMLQQVLTRSLILVPITTQVRKLKAEVDLVIGAQATSKGSIIAEDERAYFEPLFSLQSVLASTSDWKEANLSEYISRTLLPCLQGVDKWFVQFQAAVEHMAENWATWRASMFQEKRTGWDEVVAEYRAQKVDEKASAWRQVGSAAKGLSESAQRLSWNARDENGWKKLRACVIAGLLKGDIYYGGYGMPSGSIVDQLVAAFDIFPDPSLPKKIYPTPLLERPEKYFPEERRELFRQRYIYEGDDLEQPVAVLDMRLGVLEVSDIRKRRPTQYSMIG